MTPIDKTELQQELARFRGHDVYLHFETTTGTYTALGPEKTFPVVAFVRNAKVRFERGSVRGVGPYRVGLKMDDGWIYGDGLTHTARHGDDALLMAGYDDSGRLRIGLQLSFVPFREDA